MTAPRNMASLRSARLAALLCSLVALGGCGSTNTPPVALPTPVVAAPIANAQTAVEAALKREHETQAIKDAAELSRLSKLKVNVGAASEAVDADIKPVAQGELAIAKSRLEGVADDPAEIAEAERRKALVLSGKLDEAKSAYADAKAQGQRQTAEITTLTIERDTAQSGADKAAKDAHAALVQYQAELEANRASNQAAMDKLRKDMEDSARAEQIKTANRIGGYCLIGAVASLAVSCWLGFAGLILSAAFGAGSAFCFAYARLLNWPYFQQAAIGGASIVAIGIVILIWRKQTALKSAEIKASAKQAQLDEVLAYAKAEVPVLDDTYENADKDDQAWLNAHIFDPLSKVMGKDGKAAVHKIRATLAEEKSATATS